MKTRSSNWVVRKSTIDFLHHLLWDNVELKVLSMLLACLLWFQISGQQTVQRSISIPVEFVNMPGQLEISSDHPRQVDAVIRSSNGVTKVDQGKIAVVVDLKNTVAGAEAIPLTERHVKGLPYGTEIVSITPARILLVLETTARKIVTVDPVVSGRPAVGYHLAGIEVVPKEVVVRGPESRLERLSSALTEVIDMTGLDALLSFSVSVYVDDPVLRVEDRNLVTVTLKIEEERRPVDLLMVPVRFDVPNSVGRLMTKTVEVRGSVPISFSGQIRDRDFAAVVTVKRLEPNRGIHTLTPKIRSPEELGSLFRVESVSPPQIQISTVK